MIIEIGKADYEEAIDSKVAVCKVAIHSQSALLPAYIQIGDIDEFRCFEDKDKKCRDCEHCAMYEFNQTKNKTTLEEYVEDNK